MADDKIGVLHIIKTLGLGGAEVNLLNMVRVMDPRHFSIHVAYSAGGSIEPQFLRAGVRLYKFAEGDHTLKSFSTVGIVLRLADYIRKHRIKIVHTHTFNAQIWGALAAKLTGARVIEHVHDFRYLDPKDFLRRRGFSRQYGFVHWFKGWSKRVVVLTKQNRDFLIQQGLYRPEQVLEIQNGIPLDSMTLTKNAPTDLGGRWGIAKDALIIFTPVRLAAEKNIDLLIRIAPEVIKEVPNAVFLVAGTGPLENEISAQIAAKGLGASIKLIGFQENIVQLLAGTHVFLLPSFLELHSIAILEAMSLGVPVVVSQDVGCNSEFIQSGVNGFLCDPFADAGWSEVLITLLKDPYLRKRVGAAGLATCRQLFDIRTVARKFEELYRELATP